MQLYSAPSIDSMLTRVRAEKHAHTVQFYESDGFLSKVVADHIANGLGNGEPSVVIATQAHIQQIWGRLRLKGFELDLLEQSGQLQLLEAEALLSKFMVKGRPDSDKFNSVVHGLMRKANAARPHRTVRAYGEMVDLLCKSDNSAAALELERLWNEAGKKYEFTLLCGYEISNFPAGTLTSTYVSLCGMHDRVFTPEA